MQNKDEVRERMMAMIEDWKISGLKQKHYCEARNIAYHVFHYWYGVYRTDSPGKESFLPHINPITRYSTYVKTIATPQSNYST